MNELSFGQWLSRQRKYLGMTQRQLAERLNCATITLRKIEAEERRPSAQMLERLAKVVEIPPRERAAFLSFARGYPNPVPSTAKLTPWLPFTGSAPSDSWAYLISSAQLEQNLSMASILAQSEAVIPINLSGSEWIGKQSIGFKNDHELVTLGNEGVYLLILVPIKHQNQEGGVSYQ